MTTYYVGIDAGNNEYQAAVDTSTTSKGLEIVFDGTKFTSKTSVLLALENLSNFITRTGFPPA